MESRVLLAADAAVAVAGQITHGAGEVLDGACYTQSLTGEATAASDGSQHLVFVDSHVEDLEVLVGGIGPEHELILLDANQSGLEQITQTLRGRSRVQSIQILAHGKSGAMQLGNQMVTQDTLRDMQGAVNTWTQALTETADILLLSCHTGEGEVGKVFVRRLAELTGADVAASTDATGSAIRNGNWVLERMVGTIETPIAVNSDARDRYQSVLPLTIYAAGETGNESMSLLVDGMEVQRWDNVGGNADAREFVAFQYEVDGLSADRVRVAFNNDLYDPANGIDNNLRVDRIEIDGNVYETEDPSVYSTGTWLPADGVTPGFRENETLHVEGYFEFAEPVVIGDSGVTIFAAGDTGSESMSLLIDGVEVRRWDNVGGDFDNRVFRVFQFEAEGVSPDQVRIALNNDRYEPENGIDYNLNVDKIVIDGTTYETEDPSVFSTGTWLPADGIVAGNRQSETLHTVGYFQYAERDVVGDEGSVIINEIHYNPGPDGTIDGDAEFLELFNPGDEGVDLSGMSFVGFNLTFAQGTVLGPGQYAIVSPSIAIAQAEWGVTPIAEFTSGGLSGGGELIQLIAADGVTVIDEVEYSDSVPWPGAPDGNGPSLELLNPVFDNNNPANWRPSLGAPTPGAVNSTFTTGVVGDITDIVVNPETPLPGEQIVISAVIENATQASLVYRLNFGEEQVVAMTTAGEDVWQGVVPGQAAGTLVRYRIESDVAVAPFEGDTINYFGVVVAATDIVDNQLPVFQWYVDPVQFEELVTDLFLTNTTIPTVVAYNGQVVDNATVRVRGDFSRTFDKKSFKIELPDGYTIDFGELAVAPLDEFGLFADHVDWGVVRAPVSWSIFNAETDSTTSTFLTRVEQNSDFYGVYRLQELYDGAFRSRNTFDDGEFFKGDEGGWYTDTGFERDEPDGNDLTSVLALRDRLAEPASPAKTAFLYDNVNIPSVINHMALTALTRHYDQGWHNFYLELDGPTGRWQEVEWDLDVTWDPSLPIEGDSGEFTTPVAAGSFLMNSLWEVPEIREMYWQRLQTLVDKYLADDKLIDLRNELIESIGATNSDLEFAKWGRSDIFESTFFAQQWQDAIETRRTVFANEARLPGANLDPTTVVINELHYNPDGDDAEFIELLNTGNQAIDLSGWQIDGIGLTIENGTVILPGQYMVFTDNDRQFRTQKFGNVLVGGQYSGALSNGGETIALLDANGTVIDEVTYDDADPWVTEPDGSGVSLALIDPTSDNSLAVSWAVSNQRNGTPGAANNIGAGPGSTEVKVFAAGQTTSEVIELEVNGQVVANYNLGVAGSVVGDYAADIFVELQWSIPADIDVDVVRVNFVNDLYDPANGIDYNVKVDRIEVNGSPYETESPAVFSTGTYIDGVGFEPGFWETEILHGNGYFQYLIV